MPSQRRSETQAWQGWYKLARWKKLRDAQLKAHPTCQCPHNCGQRATVVDHIKRHNGDPRLFWNPRNLQSMAKTCHDSRKQSQERGGHGFDMGSDTNGQPLNPQHPWHSS